MQNILSPLQAQVVQWLVQPGEIVTAGDVLVILEAMKMEHEIRAPHPGSLAELYFQAGETVNEGDALASWTRMEATPMLTAAVGHGPVSYTHLTLPTKRIV